MIGCDCLAELTRHPNSAWMFQGLCNPRRAVFPPLPRSFPSALILLCITNFLRMRWKWTVPPSDVETFRFHSAAFQLTFFHSSYKTCSIFTYRENAAKPIRPYDVSQYIKNGLSGRSEGDPFTYRIDAAAVLVRLSDLNTSFLPSGWPLSTAWPSC